MSKSPLLVLSKVLCLIIWGLAIVLCSLILIQIAEASVNRGTPVIPAFSKTFSPDAIGAGSVSTLQFDISNPTMTPATNIAFTDNLPMGVVIATPPNAISTCTGGMLSAPAGGATITYSDGGLGASSSCSIVVNVTAGSVGMYVNTTGDLTSSAGNSGTASDTLNVSSARPGFSKSFTPSSIVLGQTSTIVFTIDNTANTSPANSLSFSDSLPSGMLVANPANASTTCTGGILTATPGSGSIGYIIGSIAASSSCTIMVDVTTSVAGVFDNITGELTSSAGTSGKAGATLQVEFPFMTKKFIGDPVIPGDTVTLEFSITNLDRFDPATSISFTDNLGAALSGLSATGLPLSNPCGAGSTLSGTSLLTLSNGNLPSEGTCTFSVTVQAPAAAPSGTYTNTTSSVTYQIRGDGTSANPATDDLIVQPAPRMTKSFTNDPAIAGGNVTLQFTITNTHTVTDATGIAFADSLANMLPGIGVTALPSNGFCGPSSSMIQSPAGVLNMTSGSLGPNASCTFSATLQIPSGVLGGTFLNSTSGITATVNGEALVGKPATDNLIVVAAPRLTKSFTNDPGAPGGTVTLEFTLSYDENAPASATGITFSDNLNATLPGLAATDLPLSNPCGAGSQLSGTTNLSLTGASLSPAASCTFAVTLQVPANATAGNYLNITSPVSATVLSKSTTSNAASDTLQVASLTFQKAFTDDPVVPGGTVTLQFMLENTSPLSTTTDISFTDNLDAALSGLVATGLPLNNICGAGSQIAGTSVLAFTAGNLSPGASCIFDVTLQVPALASFGEYVNTTSLVTANAGATPITVEPALDTFTVINALSIIKTFTDDPVAPGETLTLEFTITNSHPSQIATSISFSDDLDAALPGLVATGLPLNNICGAGSIINGTSLLTFTGGSLAALSSCTFSVSLQVPLAVPFGAVATNTTSQLSGTIDAVTVNADPASDDLEIDYFVFTKAFDGAAFAGDNTLLTFTIQNLSSSASATGFSFSDDLNAVLSGLVATGLPTNNVCGAGSQLSGTSLLTLNSGELGAGATCTFSVTLQVPLAASPGNYLNTTSDLSLSGLSASHPATDTLSIVAAPNFPVYLPILVRNFATPITQPDLVVTNLIAGSNSIAVVIRNFGAVATADDFWVDVYINPSETPSLNKTWPLIADHGLVWGVTAVIQPGAVLTLTINGPYFQPAESNFIGLVSGDRVWAQVDSVNLATAYGNILETDETNNVYGPLTFNARARIRQTVAQE